MPAETPQIAELMAAHLKRLSDAHAAGFVASERGEVEPYEAVPAQVLDPKLAWDEATTALSGKVIPPSEWPQLVVAPESAVAIAFAAGNFPQMVRDLPRLARAAMQPTPPVESGAPVDVDGLNEWVDGADSTAHLLMAAGILRLARQFDRAEKLLNSQTPKLSAAMRVEWGNEQAALLWHRGRHGEAIKRWQSLPETAPVLFNRGMAALFAGDKSAARRDLTAAVAVIPDSSGWHHLGRLYLALALS